MKRAIKYLLLSTFILVMLLPVVGFAQEDKEVSINDANFKNALRELCGIEQGKKLYMSDVEKLTGDIDLSNNDIKSANGIKYLVNATSIDLSHNNVSELRGDFSALVNLKSLDLSNNDMFNKCSIYIEDIPNLEHLDISANKMTYLVDLFGKLKNLQSLNISANRMTDMPIALIDFYNLTTLKCDYNFFDLSDGSKDREVLDKLYEKGCEIYACKQLVKLPEISYSTSDGKLVAKWKKLDEVEFYDESKANIVGYTILLDGKFQKSVSKDTENYIVNDVSSGKSHKLSVSPDYNITDIGDFKIRSYTILDSVVLGKSGPKLEDNATPVKHDNYYGLAPIEEPQPTDEIAESESDQSNEPVLTYEEQEAEQESVEQETEMQDAEKAQEAFAEQPQEKSSNLLMLVSLLVVILVLIAIIAILLIKLWRNKNYVGKDEIDFED